MTTLTEFRDHCRRMAAKPSKPNQWDLGGWCVDLGERLRPDHGRCDRPGCKCACHPGNEPPSDADRDLFRRLADEVDAYLAPSTAAPDLFGGASEQGVAS